jgi:hypothetical protein
VRLVEIDEPLNFAVVPEDGLVARRLLRALAVAIVTTQGPVFFGDGGTAFASNPFIFGTGLVAIHFELEEIVQVEVLVGDNLKVSVENKGLSGSSGRHFYLQLFVFGERTAYY